MARVQWLSGPISAIRIFVVAALVGCAAPVVAGDRLLATWGVSSIEGAGGGGLTPWALIAGSGSRNQVGATAFVTHLRTQGGYTLRASGVAVGIFDTVELSAADWRFGLSDTVPGQSIRLQTLGIKWRVLGDAVYDQDRWWPQVAVGLLSKHNRDMAVPTALGARRGDDLEPYVAGTKVWLGGVFGRNALASLTLRDTRANQFGLLGFGGDRDGADSRHWCHEGALAVLPRDDLAVGIEWRTRPDNLAVFREQTAADAFVAWFAGRHVSLTLAWVGLGNVANKPAQRGPYLSVQAAL